MRGTSPPVSRLIPPAAAAGSGVLIWLAFPPVGWWFSAPVGVAILGLLLRRSTRRSAAVLGLAAGLGLWLPTLSFLGDLSVAAWLVLAAIETVWIVLLAVALYVVRDLRWWPIAGALLWTGQEFCRDRIPFDGFPWGRLAFGQANGPLLHAAAVGGAPLVTFLVALIGGGLAWAVVSARGGRAPLAAVGLGLVAAAVLLPLAISLPTGGTSRDGRPASAVVAVVQGNVPRLGLEEFAQKHAVTAYHLAETRRLAAQVQSGELPQPDVVVWPENSSDYDPYDDPVARSMIDEAVAAIDAPIVVGAVLDGPGAGHVRNAAVVWSPSTGAGQVYVKRHLVPFGEYLPFRGVMTKLVSKFALIPNDFVPGHTPGVLTAGPVRLGDVICFEVADDGVVRDAVTGGGRLLAVQTNNADYERAGDSGRGGETAQQLAMTQLRAVEHGRAAVVAATSGVSAVVSPAGKILERTGVFTPAVIDVRVPLRDPRTIADRLGPWPDRGLAITALAALILGLRQSRRSKPEPIYVSEADPTPVGAVPA